MKTMVVLISDGLVVVVVVKVAIVASMLVVVDVVKTIQHLMAPNMVITLGWQLSDFWSQLNPS